MIVVCENGLCGGGLWRWEKARERGAARERKKEQES